MHLHICAKSHTIRINWKQTGCLHAVGGNEGERMVEWGLTMFSYAFSSHFWMHVNGFTYSNKTELMWKRKMLKRNANRK
jgi:hypothetical protein